MVQSLPLYITLIGKGGGGGYGRSDHEPDYATYTDHDQQTMGTDGEIFRWEIEFCP
jgi:hypothetical protein